VCRAGSTGQRATPSVCASIFGGRGGYSGTIAGVLVTVLLISVLRVVGISDAGQDIAYGLVIIAMLIVFRRKAATR
jgi:ribose transport system permease protein